MVGRREAWSAWSRQVGRALGVTEYGSLPGWTRLLQGGGLVNFSSNTQTLTLASGNIYLEIQEISRQPGERDNGSHIKLLAYLAGPTLLVCLHEQRDEKVLLLHLKAWSNV